MAAVVTKRASGASVATHREQNEAVAGQEGRLGIVVLVFDLDLMEQRLGGRPPAGDATLSLRRPTVPDHLTPVVSDRDPAEPVAFYYLRASNGGAACVGAVGRDSTNRRPSNAAVVAVLSVTFPVPWGRRRVWRTRRLLRAKWRLLMRKGRSPIRANVGELRHDQPTVGGPSPGRLVSMSPCRAMAPPARLVAPMSADASGTAV